MRPRRQIAASQARTSQLEFGPNLPCFRGWMTAAHSVTVPSGGADTSMTFDCWENGNDNVFSEVTVGGLLASVQALIEGVFMISFGIQFDAALPLAAGTNVGTAVEEGGSHTGCTAMNHPAFPLAGDNSSGKYTVTALRGYPPVWLRCDDTGCGTAPCLAEWRMNVAQDDAVDHDAVLGMFEIYLVGGLSVDTSELGP